MSLLHPTPGQLVDRQIILNLKLRHATDPEQLAAFAEEREEIAHALSLIEGWLDPNAIRRRRAISALTRINHELWEANERLAAESRDDLNGFTITERVSALHVFTVNNERTQMIVLIDSTLGLILPPEKVGY